MAINVGQRWVWTTIRLLFIIDAPREQSFPPSLPMRVSGQNRLLHSLLQQISITVTCDGVVGLESCM